MPDVNAQNLIARLNLLFPDAGSFWQQAAHATPAAHERSLRASLGMGSANDLSGNLDGLNANMNSHQSHVNAAVSAVQQGQSNSAGGFLLASRAGAYSDLQTNFKPFGENIVVESKRAPAMLVVGHAAAAGDFQRGDRQIGSFVDVGGGDLLHPDQIAKYVFPNFLFYQGKFSSLQSWGMASIFMLSTVQSAWTQGLRDGAVDLSQVLQSIPDVNAMIASATQLKDDLDKTHTLLNVVETELIASFVALGVGAVIIGTEFLTAVGGISAGIAAIVAEDFGTLAATIIERGIEAATTVGHDEALQNAIDKLGGAGADVAATLQEYTSMPGGSVGGIAHKLVDMLAQTSILIDGQEVMLLEHLYITNGTEKYPLSDALAGAIYQDTSGTHRNALLTLASEIYHVDMQAGKEL